MSKDKYPSIFSPQTEAIVLIILQIFFATRADLKIRVFGHVTCLDQSHERKYLMDYNVYVSSLLGRYVYVVMS